VARLVRPVLEGRAAFVTPLLPRHPLDGLLVTQIVRPLFRAAYGYRVSEPLASELACSGAFAAHCLAQDVWDAPLARYGIDLWLTGTALSAGFPCAEAPLGRRVLGAGASRPGLPEVFRQVVGSLFGCLEAHAAFWLPRSGSSALPTLGPEAGLPAGHVEMDPLPLVEVFRSGVRDLAPLLEPVLAGETWTTLRALVEQDPEAFRLSDELWASVVCEASAAYSLAVLHREHLVRALVPVYLGRVASFLLESAGKEPGAVERRLEELALQFEARKPDLVGRWTPENVR
jgi:hypothetical protein